MGKQYSEEQKTEALKLLNSGKSLREVAKTLDIPFTTVFEWSKKERTPSDRTPQEDTLDPEQRTPAPSPPTDIPTSETVRPNTEHRTSDTLDEALAEEESDIDDQLRQLEKLPQETPSPIHGESVIKTDYAKAAIQSPQKVKESTIDFGAKLTVLEEENSRLKSEVARLRGSPKPNWNGDVNEERQKLELERERVELQLEQEELKTMRQLRRQQLLEALSGKSGKDEDDPIKRLERLATIRAFTTQGVKQDTNIIDTLDKLTQKEIERWQRQQELIEGQIEKRDKMVDTITDKVKAQLQGQKSGIEKLKEGAAVITDTVDNVAKTLKEHGIVLGQPTQPPPPQTPQPATIEPSEQAIAEKAGILPQLPKLPTRRMGTFEEEVENQHLPSDEESEEEEAKK